MTARLPSCNNQPQSSVGWDMEIRDKVVVITGGASGIGAAMARRFAADGAEAVVVSDINVDGATRIAAEIDGIAMGLDVADEPQTIRVLGEELKLL